MKDLLKKQRETRERRPTSRLYVQARDVRELAEDPAIVACSAYAKGYLTVISSLERVEHEPGAPGHLEYHVTISALDEEKIPDLMARSMGDPRMASPQFKTLKIHAALRLPSDEETAHVREAFGMQNAIEHCFDPENVTRLTGGEIKSRHLWMPANPADFDKLHAAIALSQTQNQEPAPMTKPFDENRRITVDQAQLKPDKDWKQRLANAELKIRKPDGTEESFKLNEHQIQIYEELRGADADSAQS